MPLLLLLPLCGTVCSVRRGYPIQELTEASYLESAYLVLYGNLPTRYACSSQPGEARKLHMQQLLLVLCQHRVADCQIY